MSWRDEYVEEVVGMLDDLDDETFVTMVLQILDKPEDDANPRLLYHPSILGRFKRIRVENAMLFAGRFLPAVRQTRRIWLPDLLEAMTSLRQGPDPFAFRDGAGLLTEPVQPVEWVVPGLIAEGLTILGGTPKSGKSYLAYSLALAVARYGRWLDHWDVPTGPVLFLSLEDDASDTRLRLHELDPDLTLDPGQVRFLHGVDAVPTFDQGLLPWVESVLAQYQPRLVVIDPLSYLYAPAKGQGHDLFTEMRSMVFPLRWLGKTHHCAILALDHRRKRSRDDVNIFDTLHGSIAKQAVADALLMVERDDEELTLAALVRRGKDATHHLTMQFRDGRCWLGYTGESPPKADTGNYGALRQKVYTALMTYRMAMTMGELLAELEMPNTAATRSGLGMVLIRAQKAGDIHKTERGKYIWANRDQPGQEG